MSQKTIITLVTGSMLLLLLIIFMNTYQKSTLQLEKINATSEDVQLKNQKNLNQIKLEIQSIVQESIEEEIQKEVIKEIEKPM